MGISTHLGTDNMNLAVGSDPMGEIVGHSLLGRSYSLYSDHSV